MVKTKKRKLIKKNKKIKKQLRGGIFNLFRKPKNQISNNTQTSPQTKSLCDTSSSSNECSEVCKLTNELRNINSVRREISLDKNSKNQGHRCIIKHKSKKGNGIMFCPVGCKPSEESVNYGKGVEVINEDKGGEKITVCKSISKPTELCDITRDKKPMSTDIVVYRPQTQLGGRKKSTRRKINRKNKKKRKTQNSRK